MRLWSIHSWYIYFTQRKKTKEGGGLGVGAPTNCHSSGLWWTLSNKKKTPWILIALSLSPLVTKNPSPLSPFSYSVIKTAPTQGNEINQWERDFSRKLITTNPKHQRVSLNFTKIGRIWEKLETLEMEKMRKRWNWGKGSWRRLRIGQTQTKHRLTLLINSYSSDFWREKWSDE
jgi:hypothetical protein